MLDSHGSLGSDHASVSSNALHSPVSGFAIPRLRPSLGCVPSHAGYPVRVAVKVHGYRGVPEKVLYEFRVDAAPQKEGSAGVPEIVPADRREARVLEVRLEVAV